MTFNSGANFKTVFTACACIGFALLVLLGADLDKFGGPGEKNMNESSSNAEFESVQPDSTIMAKCSPQFEGPDARGILLNAPEKVVIGDPRKPFSSAFADIVVCGACQFRYDTLGLHGQFIEEILFVAVDSTSHQSYSGKVRPVFSTVGGGSPLGDDESFHEDYKDFVVTQFFNPNLARVLHLPEREAEYTVYATLGSYKSNVVKIRVVKE